MLLERDNQLAHLRRLFETTAEKAGRGQVAVITGPVGSGKTELLHMFAEQAVGSGAALLTATASRAEQAMPLGVLDQLFRGAELPAEDARAVARLLKESVTGGGSATPRPTAATTSPRRTSCTACRKRCWTWSNTAAGRW